MPPPEGPTGPDPRGDARQVLRVADGRERNGPVHGRIDVHYAKPIAGAEKRSAARRGLVCEGELRFARHRRSHGAREIDGDDLREARAPPLLPQVEGHGRDLFDGRARVPAGAHGAVAAHEQQTAPELAHVGRDLLHLRGREGARRHVREHHQVVRGEPR